LSSIKNQENVLLDNDDAERSGDEQQDDSSE